MCPSRRRRRAAPPALAIAFAALAAAPSSSQVIRGRVIDAGTRNAVVGAYVVLFDQAGTRLNGVLTNDLGAYSVRLPRPGLFTLRAEMIGRESVDSRPLTLAATDTLTVNLTLPLAPIVLARIDVAAAKKCEVRPGAGGETYKVWDEARKALTLEAATRAENVFRFNIERFEREMDLTRTRVTSERTRYVSRYTGDPFNAMPAGHLADLGFYVERPDGPFLYGPNAEVLLSDPFLDTHCMFLRRDRGRPGLIALSFEPVPGRRVTDIRGDLWLDEFTAELRSLEFRYTGVPGSRPRGDYGGEARFQRLPGGAWIVREWSIRSPIVRLVQSNLRGQQIRSEETTGFYFEGAEVLLILDMAGNVVDETPRAVLAGIVWDSIGGAPLAGATVYLVDTGFSDTTDTTGRFRLTGLPAGTYAVSWRNIISERQGWTPEPRLVELRRGEVTEVELALTRAALQNLSAAEIARLDSVVAVGRALGRYDWASQMEATVRRPPSEVRPVPPGAVVQPRPGGTGDPARMLGKVLSTEDGKAVPGVVVSITGTELRRETDANGLFGFTEVPAGTVELRTEHLGFSPLAHRLAVEPGRSYDVVLRLTPRAIPLDPLTVSVTVEERAPWLELQGFYERKYYGGLSGAFITRTDLEKRNPQLLTDVYDDVPGVRSFWIEPGRRTVRFRRPGMGAGYGCEPAYYIDGQRYYDPLREGPNKSEVANFNAIGVDQVEAIEVYVGALVPIQYQQVTNCGVILLWTRRGRG